MIELVWEQITTKEGKKYTITSTRDRSEYYLYDVTDGKQKRLGADSDPKALESKYVK